ncbi:MAG: hypothetical protein GYA24_15605 [Candidatus Lokiarchaeota archaeon]|nr:hypothetical protein [Candidatus Lokiarchaeota archaeon]
MNTTDVKDQLDEIKNMLFRIESIIDTRLLGIEEPDKEDLDAIEDFEEREKEGRLELKKI